MKQTQFPGAALFGAVLLAGRRAAEAQSTSASNGPLRYTVRTSKPVYAPAETVVIEATLTNTGKQPVSVYPPSLYSERHWLDKGSDLLAKSLEAVRLRAPRPEDVVRLTPGQSATYTHRYAPRVVAPLLTSGKHSLAGEYSTNHLRLDGIWKGTIKTPPLAFTIR